MRLVFPPGLGFFFCRELGQLHAVDSHGDSSELLRHVNDQALLPASFDLRLRQSGLGLVLGS
jgi:hypothetical protein